MAKIKGTYRVSHKHHSRILFIYKKTDLRWRRPLYTKDNLADSWCFHYCRFSCVYGHMLDLFPFVLHA
jgi:hypothetical protein